MAFPFAALGIGAGLGALGGLFGSKTETESKVNMAPASELEHLTGQGIRSDYAAMQGMVGAGAGQSDVAAGTASQRDLAALLQQYSQGGYLPSQADISSSNDLAAKLFGAQRLGMQQSFGDQLTQANQQAALMGRSGDDPILKAKLAQEQTRQASMLDAQQGSWAQQFALNQPMQRLGFAQDRAGILGGLATQAMANRQALLSLGQGINQMEFGNRLQAAGKTTTQSYGGGLGGMFSGMIGGAGAGMSFAKNMPSLFGGGSGSPNVGALTGNNYSQSPSAFFGLSPSASMGTGPSYLAPTSTLAGQAYKPGPSLF